MGRLFILLLLFPIYAVAQKLPAIEEKTKDLVKYEGFIDFYWDESNGKIWMEIDKTGTELLYVTSLPAGLGSNDIGLDRGLLGDTRVIKFEKAGKKIFIVEPNYQYRAITNDVNEKKAVEESFARSIHWGFTVEAETGGRWLVDATDFLLRDAMQVSNSLRTAEQGNYAADKSRSAIYIARTKNFPLNTEFEATQTFVNSDGRTGNYVRSVTPSGDAITLRVHHSFIQLPDNGYKPRVYDARSGFIPVSYYDYSTPVAEPLEKRFIIRHRLEKKNPEAAKSEAVKPIIYYLDNGTPEPIRSALLDGASWWNQAFEAAGYTNAFQVKILPDGADPMDVRYNVINWVHRSTRGWSYGASVTDPRTGEIIKGHVTLGSLRVRQDYLIASGLLAPFENGVPADDKMLKMALDRLRQLSAHEVGHTLGIMHNYAASVSNRASVMDYPHPLVTINSNGEIDLGNAYDLAIGEWDKVAIAYGYQHFPPNTNESSALSIILDNAEKKGLQFISDQDARRAGGMHPQAHLWDNGQNAVDGLKNVIKVREQALKQFSEKTIRPGMPLALMEEALVPVYFYHRYQLEAVTKLIGGMHYSYALRGEKQPATRTLSREEQKSALNQVLACIDPVFLALPDKLGKIITPRPVGYESNRELFRKRTGLSFDLLSPAETAADLPFSLLFNTERLNRMNQQEVLENGLGVSEMINILMSKTWKSARLQGIHKQIQLQTEQVLLTYLLAASINDNNSFAVKSILAKALKDLEGFIQSRLGTSDEVYKGHLLLAITRMKDPEKAKPTLHREIPPGAPIGCD